jgi:Regulator of chromosome condensation (RCC1) repeat
LDFWTKRTRAALPVAIAVASAVALPIAPGLAAAGTRAPGVSAPAARGAINAWGDNSGGELGDGGFKQSDSPVAVAGANRVRAIAAGVERTLIEHWNGTWSIVPSPNPKGGSGDDELGAIDGASARDIWAAGFDFAPNEPLTLLFEHWNGSSWVAAPSPPSTGGRSHHDHGE